MEMLLIFSPMKKKKKCSCTALFLVNTDARDTSTPANPKRTTTNILPFIQNPVAKRYQSLEVPRFY